MQDIDALNRRFGLPGKLSFTSLAKGMPVAEIKTALCTARICMQGAHLIEWTPAGQKPVIWLSKDARFAVGKSIRGGVPVCWPWFGPHDSKTDVPAHGYARMVEWELLDSDLLQDEGVSLSFRIIPTEASRAMWPHATPLELEMTIGKNLELELITRNTGDQPVQIGEALHTYFAVGDVRKVTVTGLEGTEYLDKVDDFKRKTQHGGVNFSGEVDRVYVATEADCLIQDPSMRRSIRISKRGSRSTVVWNPWVDKCKAMGDMGEAGYLGMLCVESGNAASDVVTIAPGGEHRLWVRYKVES